MRPCLAVSVSGDGKWLAFNQMGEISTGRGMEGMDAGTGMEAIVAVEVLTGT
jgi:hypothetical protein